jgi:hypothetical protein
MNALENVAIDPANSPIGTVGTGVFANLTFSEQEG